MALKGCYAETSGLSPPTSTFLLCQRLGRGFSDPIGQMKKNIIHAFELWVVIFPRPGCVKVDNGLRKRGLGSRKINDTACSMPLVEE